MDSLEERLETNRIRRASEQATKLSKYCGQCGKRRDRHETFEAKICKLKGEKF